jgi:putative ABC transport system permease protein
MKWWRIRQKQADLERELQSDLELEEEEQQERGLPPEEARYAARRAFGNTTLIQEQTHDAWGGAPFEWLLQDVRYAFRQLRRSPGLAAAIVGTLTLGVGTTTAIFILLNSTLLRRLPYPDGDRILRIHDVRLQGRSNGGLVAVPRFFDLSTRSKSFESTGFFYFDDTTLIAGKQLPVSIRGAGANAGFWKVFGVRPLLGRVFDARDDQPHMPEVAVLSYAAWQHLFAGDADVIGRQVTIEQKSTTIVGVMPQDFRVPSGIDLWRPAQFSPGDWTWREEGSRFINVAARLAPGGSLAQAQADLHRIDEQLQREHPRTDGLWQFGAQSLRDDLYGELRPALLVLLLASGLLLLVACINVANLLLARATAREREVALRRALGASEFRIRLQFLTESTMLALLGGGAGLGVTFALVRTAAAKLPGRLGTPGTVEMNWPVVWFAFALAVAAGIVFGLAPALGSHARALSIVLKQGGSRIGSAAGHGVRSAFLSVQVGVSLVLLVGASLLGESLWNLLKSPLGFVPENVLTFRIVLPWNAGAAPIRDFYGNVQRRIEELPGVIAVGQTSALPTEDWHARGGFDSDWLPRTGRHDSINAEVRSISGNFLRALSIPLLAGRELRPSDALANNMPVLINRTFAQQYLPSGNPIGRHLSDDTGSFEIVGVIGDVRGTAGSIANKVGAEIYFPADGGHPNMRRSFIVRSQLPPEQLISSVRTEVHKVDPQQAIASVASMNELLGTSVALPRLNMAIITSFSVIALLLACVGIYGVVAWSVAQRVQEIGVRMALGATRSKILLLFMRRAANATAIGIVGGTCAALLLTRFLRGELYGVAADDPRVYIISILALLVPVLISTLRPALHAASVSPVDALRAE